MLEMKTVYLLVMYAFGMSCGQVLFKLAAIEYKKVESAYPILSLVQNFYFITAVLLYGSLTVFWVWLLTKETLGKAYPLVALSFVFTPLMAVAFLNEKIDVWYVAGIILIISGIALIYGKPTA